MAGQRIKKAGLRTPPFISTFSGTRDTAPPHFIALVQVPPPFLAD
jgi:hypothetical protein